MKFRQQILSCVIFLAFGASAATADPVAIEQADPAREAALVIDTRPADLFGVSLLKANEDCGGLAKPIANGTNPWLICGTCSTNVCDGALVNGICGFASGKFLRCQNWLGYLCPAEDGAACRCSSDPIP